MTNKKSQAIHTLADYCISLLRSLLLYHIKININGRTQLIDRSIDDDEDDDDDDDEKRDNNILNSHIRLTLLNIIFY